MRKPRGRARFLFESLKYVGREWRNCTFEKF